MYTAGGYLLRLRGFGDVEFDAEAGGGEHVDEGVDGEEVDAPAHEVRDAGLGGAEDLRRLSLGEAFASDVVPDGQHEGGAELHVLGEGWGWRSMSCLVLVLF